MITKNYEKMCEEDNDLKWDDKSWKPKYGDYRPTQEQLQKMLQGKWIYYKSYPLLQFCGWIMTSGGPNKFYHHQYKNQFKSINELWFAFVMYEKYHKIWNGKTWVAEKS